jgi:Pectate lyase superfamily protein
MVTTNYERLLVMKKILRTLLIQYFRSLTLRGFQRLIPLFLVVCMATSSVAAVIDVTTYGATPNDSVDDSLAIQKAIDAAPDNSTIYFPRGVYLAAGVQINNRAGLTLSGDGSTLTILKRHGSYPRIAESSGSTDILVTKLGFDVNGITSFGGFTFYDAKRITITKSHFFDSNKQPVGGYDRYSWVFGRGSVPSEEILISDNLIEDLQLEVDFLLVGRE